MFRIPLFDIVATKECLRNSTEWREKPPEKMNEPARFAEISTSRDPIRFERLIALVREGGRRTLEAAIDSLTDPPGKSYGEVTALSVAIVVAAIRHGHCEARRLSARLHEQLVVVLRDRPIPDVGSAVVTPEASDRQVLERWIPLLKKHFVMAHTFSEKRTGLSQLVAIDESRPTADAFVYAARLKLQGFDVLWERAISSPVLSLARVPPAHPNDHRVDVGLTMGDGSLMHLQEAGGHAEPSFSLREIFQSTSRTDDGVGERRSPFGNYSRIIRAARAGDSLTWFAAFREGRQEAPGAIDPARADTLVTPAGHSHSLMQAYSVHQLKDGQLLLGVRDLLTPLAVCDPVTGQTRLVEAMWGTARHGHGRVSAGERRVWAIECVDEATQLLAIGAEDGYLRVGYVEETPLGVAFRLLPPVTINAEYLGSGDARWPLARSTTPRDSPGVFLSRHDTRGVVLFRGRPRIRQRTNPDTQVSRRVAEPDCVAVRHGRRARNSTTVVLEESGRLTLCTRSNSAW